MHDNYQVSMLPISIVFIGWCWHCSAELVHVHVFPISIVFLRLDRVAIVPSIFTGVLCMCLFDLMKDSL